MITKLYAFDFDGTLMQSPEPEEGKAMYKNLFGKDYPHKGWWSKPESLHMDFDIKPHQSVLDHYHAAVADDSAHLMIMTNRLSRLWEHMDVHLARYDIKFGQKSFGDSYRDRLPKPQRLVPIITSFYEADHHIKEVVVLDDMQDQIDHYLSAREAWGADEFLSQINLRILHVQNGIITEI